MLEAAGKSGRFTGLGPRNGFEIGTEIGILLYPALKREYWNGALR